MSFNDENFIDEDESLTEHHVNSDLFYDMIAAKADLKVRDRKHVMLRMSGINMDISKEKYDSIYADIKAKNLKPTSKKYYFPLFRVWLGELLQEVSNLSKVELNTILFATKVAEEPEVESITYYNLRKIVNAALNAFFEPDIFTEMKAYNGLTAFYKMNENWTHLSEEQLCKLNVIYNELLSVPDQEEEV